MAAKRRKTCELEISATRNSQRIVYCLGHCRAIGWKKSNGSSHKRTSYSTFIFHLNETMCGCDLCNHFLVYVSNLEHVFDNTSWVTTKMTQLLRYSMKVDPMYTVSGQKVASIVPASLCLILQPFTVSPISQLHNEVFPKAFSIASFKLQQANPWSTLFRSASFFVVGVPLEHPRSLFALNESESTSYNAHPIYFNPISNSYSTSCLISSFSPRTLSSYACWQMLHSLPSIPRKTTTNWNL